MTYGTEKTLSYWYVLVMVTSVVCCICSGVAYTHWRYVLNACPDTNCGCYLHAHSTFSSFDGGSIHYCHYATFGLLLPLLVAICMGSYHLYRVCMGTAKRRSGTTTIRQRSGDMVVVTTESELSDSTISPYYWMPAGTIAAIMTVYTIVYASIYTSGFEETCDQYREALLKEIQGVGHIVPVIKSRLSCGAIFDFMDYLVESSSYERRKYGHINTGACMYLTIICAWFAVLGWLVITILKFIESRRTRAARV